MREPAAGLARAATSAIAGELTLWLNARRLVLSLPARRPLLLAVLAAHGVPCTLRVRVWRDPALGAEPLLERVADLDGPLEIVVNGRLARRGVAHLRVRTGDEVVIGQPPYLERRFAFFRPAPDG